MRPRPTVVPTTDPGVLSLPRATAATRTELSADALRRRVESRKLPKPAEWSRHRTHIIGQDRAIGALELGLKLEGPGYNVFLAGPSGTGRTTTARHILAAFREARRPLRDFVFAHNFQEPDRARLLVLPPGEGLRLKRGMERLVLGLTSKLPQALALESCHKQRDRLMAQHEKREGELIQEFQERVRLAGCDLASVGEGPTARVEIVPVVDGKPQSLAALQERAARGRFARRRLGVLERACARLRLEYEQVQRRVREVARELSARLEDFDREIGSVVIDGLMEELADDFPAPEVREYLEEVRASLRDRIPLLVQRDEGHGPGGGPAQGDGCGCEALPLHLLDPFQVNVVLSNAHRKGCPIVFERNPTLTRLFGTIERPVGAEDGAETEFLDIRAGAVLRADGGFLVLNAEDVLADPMVWKALKRTLATGLLDVRAPEGGPGTSPSALKPDPVPVDVKVVMVGDDDVYRALWLQDDDFQRTFKVKAEFDVEMPLEPDNLGKFLAFVARVVSEEKLRAPTRAALAALVEESLRGAEHRDKLSTRFRCTADLAREASYWAGVRGSRRLDAADVARAVAERHRRMSLIEEKYRESIEQDVIVVSTAGRRVGQVNGLTVFDFGDTSFGKPCRVTASVGIGAGGILNIERECWLSGETHDKGVYILTGFLRNRFGGRTPLALDASICLEQSYGPVDGDSASSTEVYAVLSCLAGLPLAQGVAATGSVSQHGDIQPIGGVNQKIEGFFEICQARGLDGSQGVLIPRRNLRNLMLRGDVVKAVRAGRFHVWAISTVDEGMEILTGVAAGELREDGEYPPGTVNARVLERLRAMAAEMRKLR